MLNKANNLRATTAEEQVRVYDEKMRLVDAYYAIAMVYAEKAARRGEHGSVCYCPSTIKDEMFEKLISNGFTVSEYGVNFSDKKIGAGAYCIRW